MTAPLASWWAEPPPAEVRQRLEQLRRLPDVQRVAVLPDVHLGGETCVGVAVATLTTLYPDLVGNDVGCGVAAAPLYGAQWSAEAGPTVLAAMSEAAPIRVRPRDRRVAMPAMLADHPWPVRLSEDGTFGTLGRGNHFLELQQDEDGLVWLTVHTGSRALGPAVQDWYRARASPRPRPWLDADSPLGARYLADINALRVWARANRASLLAEAGEAVCVVLGGQVALDEAIEVDHDHVQREVHDGVELLVHRKGAICAAEGQLAVIPGSMGTPTFHVRGRGHGAALGSASHGAGRCLSRGEAHRHVRPDDLRRQLGDVLVDPRKLDRLVSEAPEAFKPIGAVMRAQRELVAVVRRLQPLACHKGV
jgi:tRNA-splicing ligase RtcB